MASYQIHNKDKFFRRLKDAFNESKLTQEALRQKIAKQGQSISQSALSKLLKDGEGLNKIDNALIVGKGLGIDLNELFSEGEVDSGQVPHSIGLEARLMDSMEKTDMIFRADDSKILPYLNHYSVYFLSNISDEEKRLTGDLSFSASEDQSCCLAQLVLKFGDAEEDIKKYHGIMMASQLQRTVYCSLINEEYEEISHIYFRFITILNKKQYDGGLALVLTVCAGGKRLPTVHKLLLSREPVPEEYLEEIEGQLALNSSEITISQKNVEMLLEKHRLDPSFVSHFVRENAGNQPLTFCGSQPAPYYEFDEGGIRTSKNLNREVITETIHLLRKYSVSPLNCKLSEKSDDLIRKYLKDRGLYSKHTDDSQNNKDGPA